jgi:hypothetical protein
MVLRSLRVGNGGGLQEYYHALQEPFVVFSNVLFIRCIDIQELDRIIFRLSCLSNQFLHLLPYSTTY